MQIRTDHMSTTAQFDWSIQKVRSDKRGVDSSAKRVSRRGEDTVQTSPIAKVFSREITRSRAATASRPSEKLAALAQRFRGEAKANFSDQEVDRVMDRMFIA